MKKRAKKVRKLEAISQKKVNNGETYLAQGAETQNAAKMNRIDDESSKKQLSKPRKMRFQTKFVYEAQHTVKVDLTQSGLTTKQ